MNPWLAELGNIDNRISPEAYCLIVSLSVNIKRFWYRTFSWETSTPRSLFHIIRGSVMSKED